MPAGVRFCPYCTATAEVRGGHDHISIQTLIRITVGRRVLEWKGKFIYLGTQSDSAGSLDIELARRRQQATTGFQQLSNSQWRQKCVETAVNVQVCQALVSQVLIYGSHSRESYCSGMYLRCMPYAGDWVTAELCVRLRLCVCMLTRFVEMQCPVDQQYICKITTGSRGAKWGP